jgi:hypothetical protein
MQGQTSNTLEAHDGDRLHSSWFDGADGDGGIGIEYHCTEQELVEAGFAGSFIERSLEEMPEHESEFAPEAAIDDPLDYLDEGASPAALLELCERWAPSQLSRLMGLTDAVLGALRAPGMPLGSHG